MNDPQLFLHKRHQISFEELVRKETHKFMTRDTKKKVIDKAKQYGLIVAAPNIIAGTLGFAVDGAEGAVEAMKQVSISVLPYTLALQGLNEFIQRKEPSDNINYVLEKKRTDLKKLLKFAENPPATIRGSGIYATLGAGIFYGLSLLTEQITGIDFNHAQIALTGATLALLDSAKTLYDGNILRNKIIDYTSANVEEIRKKEGTRLNLDDLECLVRGALENPDLTHKIYIASSEKQFRGIGGALGFFGALDSLADKDRDPTRVKPKVTLNLKSENYGYGQKYPQFTFEYERKKSKTDTITDVVKLANIRSNDMTLEIHPLFRGASLNSLLEAPYEQLGAVYIHGRKDGADYFKIRYDFNTDADNIEVTINSRQHLDVVSDLFRCLYGRSIEDVDFDQELIRMSEKKVATPRLNSMLISGNIKQELESLNISPSQFGMLRTGDPLDDLLPKKDLDYGSSKNEKDKPYSEQPEQPLSELASLPKIVLAIYGANKEKIQPTRGGPSLDIAFEGLVYSLSPMDHDQNRNKTRAAFHIIGNPLGTVKSLLADGEVLPSLKEAKITTQMTGITRKNVYAVIRELGNIVEGLTVDVNMSSIDYDTFWKTLGNPQLLADKAYAIEVKDKTGTKITLYFGETLQSYKTIRDEYFPSGEVLEAKAEESRHTRESGDFSRLGLFGMFGKSRFEKELEKTTYEVVAANGKIPGHIVMYDGDDHQPFMQNSTVHISTKGKIFIDTPVYPSEGIRRVTDYLVALRESIQKVGTH